MKQYFEPLHLIGYVFLILDNAPSCLPLYEICLYRLLYRYRGCLWCNFLLFASIVESLRQLIIVFNVDSKLPGALEKKSWCWHLIKYTFDLICKLFAFYDYSWFIWLLLSQTLQNGLLLFTFKCDLLFIYALYFVFYRPLWKKIFVINVEVIIMCYYLLNHHHIVKSLSIWFSFVFL